MAGLHSGDWQQKKSVLQCNKYMLDNRINCDVTFSFKGGKETISRGRSTTSSFLVAHKYVLMSRSAFFYNKFAGQEKNCNMNITDIDMNIFGKMLKFLYYEEADLNRENVVPMLQCAKKCMVVELVERCKHVIERSLTKDNVCLFLDQLSGMGEKEIEEKCLELFDSVADEVLQAPYFSRVKKATLERIVGRDSLDVHSEVDVFNACVSWGEAYCLRNKQKVTDEAIRAALGNILFLIRFPVMSLSDYSNKVATRTILTADESLQILLYLNKTKSTCQAPFKTMKRSGAFRECLLSLSTIKLDSDPSTDRITYVTVRENMRIAAIYFINPSNLNIAEVTFGNFRTSKISQIEDRKVAGYDVFQAMFDRPVIGTPGEFPVAFSTAIEPRKTYPAIDYDEKIYSDKEKPMFPSYYYGHFLIGFKCKVNKK